MDTSFIFSTDNKPRHSRTEAWNAVIAESYFPLDLSFRTEQKFNGRLERAMLGHVGFSRLISEPVRYERRNTHVSESQKEDYLVTIPRSTPINFRQLGKDVRCDPGGGTDDSSSAVRIAHMTRVDRFIRTNLRHPDLSPGFIAAGCGISTRYRLEASA